MWPAEHPEIVRDLEARLLAYARQQKPSEWIKAQPAFVGEQGKTVLDPDFDIDDGGLPHEKPQLPDHDLFRFQYHGCAGRGRGNASFI